MTEFFFNCWCLEIPLDNHIQHIPGCIYNHAQTFDWKHSKISMFEVKSYPTAVFHRSTLVWVLLCIWEFCCLTSVQITNAFWCKNVTIAGITVTPGHCPGVHKLWPRTVLCTKIQISWESGCYVDRCGNLPQSARSQVGDWLPGNRAVKQHWTSYLATYQWSNKGLVTWQRLSSYPTVQMQQGKALLLGQLWV
jgi:hypothetical protein